MDGLRALIVLTVCACAVRSQAADKPVPAAEAAGKFSLPDGFQATLFAGEPDVSQPIAVTFDDRGRLWVVECYSYPDWKTTGHDRVLILEDTNGDGRFDRRTVFWDEGSNLTGIALGYGGVWLCSIPNLLFVPDADGDDRPDAAPRVVLDGWDMQAKHNVVNGLLWGPDGWLYGCNGILSNSRVGKPGTAANERAALNCGVWRYHPTRETVEAVAHGTTNPWGIDFDDYGQMFITNCVIAHLWHVVPGAHFQRMFGQDINPNSYELLQSCSDHLHWAGGPWQEARGGQRHHEAGGGHAHSGAMVYLGDNWPDSYRQHLFTCNIHGNRVNQDVLERHGSGYVAHHAPDFLLANDAWFRGLAVTYGPDGAGYVVDWTDTGECHDYDAVERENGRIYKVTYGAVKPWNADLAKHSDDQLIDLQLHKNDWQVRHARRLLAERHAAGKLADGARQKLRAMLDGQQDVTRRLRALWALHATGGLTADEQLALLADKDPEVRAWTIQLALERRNADRALLARLAALADSDPSPIVRLYLAAGLQRLPLEDRRQIAAGLVRHADDAADANLPLMTWYGVEPLVAADPARALELAAGSKLHLVNAFLARRAAGVPAEGVKPAGLTTLVQFLTRTDDVSLERDLLSGMAQSLQGRRNVAMPEGWAAAFKKLNASPQDDIRRSATALTLVFGDKQAVTALEKTAADPAADRGQRAWAVEALVQARDKQLVGTLQALVAEPALAGVALRGLAAFDDARTPEIVVAQYAKLAESDRVDAVSTLCSRPIWALALLKAIEQGGVPRTALSAEQVRQLEGLNHPQVRQRLAEVWGIVRQTAADKQAQLTTLRTRLAPESLKTADRAQGRAVFARVCANCHTLFNTGGKLGPDLTGSQRTNLDYVLTNVLDPSAVVARDYQLVVVQTDSGRVLNGIVKQEDDKILILQTTNELVTLTKDEIAERKQTTTSMMPEGLFAQLNDAEVRDLVAYLASPEQVPLPAPARSSAAAGSASP